MPMAGRQQHPSIGIVADSPAGQRFAERLGRQGVQSHAVTSDALAEQAQAGQLFLAPLGSGAAAVAVVQRGGHVCLLPPWPLQPITLGGATVGAVEVEQRGMAHGAFAFGASGASSGAAPDERQSFKILYRERLVGELGVALAESEAGEPVLASLPRTSNRHGYLLVTTLQLSVASAQTRLDDVARLITCLLAWLARHDEPVGHTPPERQQESEQRQLASDSAPIVALALSLLLSAQPGLQNSAIQREAAQTAYAQVCQALGQAVDLVLFHAGWAWLEAHGVITPQDGKGSQVDIAALERYGVQWQLGPRLRRLRRADGPV